ncbi:MAG: hypothetical protein APF77_22720 [Clostridia bacterium BRH_c25]|nr:MAG: hypothetical protein APF77_22720 [Clostridia bacterium BRH_c25]
MTTSFRDLERVCKALGLKGIPKTNGVLWKGYVKDKFVKIMIHKHNGGKDVPTGTFNSYVKELGFSTVQEYNDYLNSI